MSRITCSIVFLLSVHAVAREEAPSAPVAEAPAATAVDVSRELHEIGAALRALRSDAGAPTGSLVDRITACGSGAPRASFEILATRRVPIADGNDAPQVLSMPQRELLLSALSRMPRKDVEHIAAEAGARAAQGDHAAALALVHLLGAVGTSADLARLTLVAPRKPRDPETSGRDASSLSRDARDALRDAAAAILARDEHAWQLVGGVIRTSDRAAARALLEAVGSRRDARALAVLAEAVRAHPDLAPLCVSGAQKTGRSLDSAVVSDFVGWMAYEVQSARPEQRRGLLQAIASLDDGTHASVLIDALRDEDEGVRGSALWGLRAMTGFGFPATPETWEAWHSAESCWSENERPRRRAELLATNPSRVAAALRAYSGRRAWREELATDVVMVLDRKEPELRALACEVLADLGALGAMRPLGLLLFAPERVVRDAALHALETIGGVDLPDDPDRAYESLFPAG